MAQAKSAFTTDKMDATPDDWEGGQLSRTRWIKTFTGELEGTSVVAGTMLEFDDQSTRAYVALERIDCVLHGRKGSFVLMHAATMAGSEHQASWTIVAGSGTGELKGITGAAQILPGHDFVVDYELGS